jgi:hypothetical protein
MLFRRETSRGYLQNLLPPRVTSCLQLPYHMRIMVRQSAALLGLRPQTKDAAENKAQDAVC